MLADRLPYVTLLLRVHGNTEAERWALEQRRDFDKFVAALVAEAAAEGDVRADLDPAVVTRLLFGMINSLVEWYRPDGALGEGLSSRAISRRPSSASRSMVSDDEVTSRSVDLTHPRSPRSGLGSSRVLTLLGRVCVERGPAEPGVRAVRAGAYQLRPFDGRRRDHVAAAGAVEHRGRPEPPVVALPLGMRRTTRVVTDPLEPCDDVRRPMHPDRVMSSAACHRAAS